MSKIIYGYFGHPKSASTWMGGLCLGVCIDMGLKPYYKQLAISNDIESVKTQYDFIISQNTSYEKVQQLENYRGIHIIRDPRDMATSAYYSYRYTHSVEGWPALAALRDRLNQMSFEEGLFEIFKFNDWFLKFMDDWNYEDPNILELKMEYVTKNSEEAAYKIFEFMGLLPSKEPSSFSRGLFRTKAFINRVGKQDFMPFKVSLPQKKLNRAYLKRLNDSLSFKKLAKGRKKGEENAKSHYRKGKSGDWKEKFTPAHTAYFKEHYGDLLIKLGYEKDLDW